MEWNKSLNRVLTVISVVLGLCVTSQGAPKYKVLHSFTGSDGSGPYGGVTLDRNGNLYGTTPSGGTGTCGLYNCGVVFQVTPHANGEWSETVLYDFLDGNDGAIPYGHVILDASGNIYGTNTKGGAHEAGTAFELTPGSGGWEFNTLFAFCPKVGKSGCEDGGGTQAGLTLDQSGNLYGPKPGGGGYAGAVFELLPGSGGWNERILYAFGVKKGDGAGPYADLIFDAAGDVYGTTQYGGNQCGSSGCGTVYELSPSIRGVWRETILHRFVNNGTDGVGPGSGALLMAGSGSLYGTTTGGGINACGGLADDLNGWPPAEHDPSADIGNCGTIFKLTKGGNGKWNEAILYNFKSGPSGHLPYAGVVMDNSGNLYGTTDGGGNSSGCGVIYKLAPQPKGKWKYTVLYTFTGSDDGCVPAGNLVFDKKGNLFGGTVLGGATGNGVIFELTP